MSLQALIDHQTLLTFFFLSFGISTAFLISFFSNTAKSWKRADLLWVILGGVGLITATLSTIALTEIREVQNKIGDARLELRELNRLSQTFTAKYCDGTSGFLVPVFPDEIGAICSDVRNIISDTNEENIAFQFVSLFSKEPGAQIQATDRIVSSFFSDEMGSEGSEHRGKDKLDSLVQIGESTFSLWGITRLTKPSFFESETY